MINSIQHFQEQGVKNLTEILYLFLDYPHKYYVFKYFEV